MLKIKRVVVGMSGGIDSAVTAYLLKNKGFDVQALFMRNWDIADEQGQCSADKDFADASAVCKRLNIPLHEVNFVKQYWNDVFVNVLKEYQTGYTPNPDILCNRFIKFNYFYKYATERLKADAIATGHYARTNFGPYLEHYTSENVKLLKAHDSVKDQTFFLSQAPQEALQRTMFPLGELTKSEVREIAVKAGLNEVAFKKESMGICFIGSRNFQEFISEYVENMPGNFIDLDTNRIVGEHQGIHQWTCGQRSRIPNCRKPYYIARKNPISGTIYVASGNHPALYNQLLFTSKPYWINAEPEYLKNGFALTCEFKFQHVEEAVKCTVLSREKGLVILLDQPLRAVTPGQYAVLYLSEECLGSARIVNPGPSLYFLNWKENNIGFLNGKRETLK